MPTLPFVAACLISSMATPNQPDLRYVSPPASDAANQVSKPAKFPVELYPEIEPHESGLLDVGDGHKIYYDGKPCPFCFFSSG